MSSYAIRPKCFPPVCDPWAPRIACHRSVRCAPHFLVNPALATVFPTQGRGARETRKRAVLTATGERGARLTGRLRGCPCQKARGGMGHGPSKDASKWKGARGWPCGVRERVFRIGPIRHCISNRAIYFDMPTCWMTGLFGTASERQILMAGVRGRLEKGRQAGIRLLHHDVAAARHKGNNRAKRGTSHRPLAPAGKKGTRKGRADWHCPVPGRWATLMARKALSGGGQGKEPLGPYAVGANKRGIGRGPDQLSRVSTTLASLSVSFTWLSSTKRRSGAMPWVSTRYSLVFWARRMARFRRDLAVMSC